MGVAYRPLARVLRGRVRRAGHRARAGRWSETRAQIADCGRGDHPMKTIEMSTASKPLSEYANELDEDVVVLTLHDKPIAALVSLRGVDRESLSLSTNRDFP